MRILLRALASLCFALLLLGGCAGNPRGEPDLLGFLQDGSTRREDVYLRLGEPSAQYESGRILAFRLAKDEGGLYPVTTPYWPSESYSLILVFDAQGLLSRHALVQVREE